MDTNEDEMEICDIDDCHNVVSNELIVDCKGDYFSFCNVCVNIHLENV